MTSKERVMSAFRHKEGDRIPYDIGAGKSCKFTYKFYLKLLDYLGIEEEVQICNTISQLVYASDRVLEELGCDVRAAKPNLDLIIPENNRSRDWEDEKNYYKIDEWGTSYRMAKDGGLYYDMSGFPMADAEDGEDDAKYVFPSAPGVKASSLELVKEYQKNGYPVTIAEHFGNGFLQTGPRIFGFDNWLCMLAAEPERAEAMLDKLLEVKMAYWDNMLGVYGNHVDFISECDDLGTQTSSFISYDMFRELILPYHRKLYSHIKSKYDVKILLHSCGAVSGMIGDLIDAGVDALNPVQTTAANMDPQYLKREFGKDIVFWGGGIDTQHTLPFGSPGKIKDMVKRNIDILGKDGGFIFATIHNIQPDVPIENFVAMMEALREYSAY